MNPTPIFVSAMSKNLLQKYETMTSSISLAATGAALAMLLMFASPPGMANAAMSGGRMGGSFPAASSSSSIPSTRSYSSSGYSGGSCSSSYYYHSPAPSPAPIVIHTTPTYDGARSSVVASDPDSAIGSVLFAALCVLIWLLKRLFEILQQAVYKMLNDVYKMQNDVYKRFLPTTETTTTGSDTSFWRDETSSSSSPLGPGTTMAQISVALDVSNRDDANSILSVMSQLSTTAETDSRVGIQTLTSQVALELLRRKSSIVSAATRSEHFSGSMSASASQAQREFNSRSVEERGKFERVTVNKYMGVDYASSSSWAANDDNDGNTSDATTTTTTKKGRRRLWGLLAPKAEEQQVAVDSTTTTTTTAQATMAVVTLLIAISGNSTQLPNIDSMGDVDQSLRKIASDSIVDDCLLSAITLWTPTDRGETLTRREVAADYPDLRTV
jgi:uncharacterized membrane protein